MYVNSYTQALGYTKPNMRFVQGYIECLFEAGIEDNSIDLVISNCVVNLSPDKPKVLAGVYAALRVGGEFYFSDVYADRRIPDQVRRHPVLFGECLGGALYIEDFRRICNRVGFTDVRVLTSSSIEVRDQELLELVGETKFFSVTFRCFKLPQLETLCEDYGQVAYYLGTIPGHAHSYLLDGHHKFETGRPLLVCGNTAMMLSDTWLKKHFRIEGSREIHFGLFPGCAPSSIPPLNVETGSSDNRSSGGGCC